MSQLPFPPAEQVLLWSCRHLHPGGRHGSVNLKHVMHIHIESISKICPNRTYSLLAKRYAYVPSFLEFFVHTDIPAVGLDVFHLLLYLQVFPSQDIQMKILTATVAANPHELSKVLDKQAGPRRLNLTHLTENPRTIDGRNYATMLKWECFIGWCSMQHTVCIHTSTKSYPYELGIKSESCKQIKPYITTNVYKCLHPVTWCESVPHRTFSPPLLLARPPFRRFRYLGCFPNGSRSRRAGSHSGEDQQWWILYHLIITPASQSNRQDWKWACG